MHTDLDTQTVTNTLALYGVRRRSPLYLATRAVVRGIVFVVLSAVSIASGWSLGLLVSALIGR